MTHALHMLTDAPVHAARGKPLKLRTRDPGEKAFEDIAKSLNGVAELPKPEEPAPEGEPAEEPSQPSATPQESRIIPHFLLASHVQSAPVEPVRLSKAPAAAPRSSTPVLEGSVADPAGASKQPLREDAPPRVDETFKASSKPEPLKAPPARAERSASDAGSSVPHLQQKAQSEPQPLKVDAGLPGAKIEPRSRVTDDDRDEVPSATSAPARAERPERPAVATSRVNAVPGSPSKHDDEEQSPQLTIFKMPEGPAPSAPSPARQIVDAVVPAVSDAQSILRLIADKPEAQPVVRTLQIGLQPKDLGQLRLTLRLGADGLDLRVEAESKEAARSLEQDKGLLGRLLQDAGVAVPAINIDVRVGRFEPQATPTDTRGSWLQSQDTGTGQGASFARREQNPQGQPDAQTASPVRNTRHETDTAVTGRSRGVYL